MSNSVSQSERRLVSPILAAVLLLASLPLTSGVIVVVGPDHPEFTMNICQPIPSFDRTATILLARPASTSPQFLLADLGFDASETISPRVGFLCCPDPPPPKPLA